MYPGGSLLYDMVKNPPYFMFLCGKWPVDTYEVARLVVNGEVGVTGGLDSIENSQFWLYRESIAKSEEVDDMLFMRSLHDGGRANLLPLMIKIIKETMQKRGRALKDTVSDFIRQEDDGMWHTPLRDGHGIERGTVCVRMAMERLGDLLAVTQGAEVCWYNRPIESATQSELDTLEELKSAYASARIDAEEQRRKWSIIASNRKYNEEARSSAMVEILKIKHALHTFGVTGKKHEKQAAKSATTKGDSK